jgi:hypothetical protein
LYDVQVVHRKDYPAKEREFLIISIALARISIFYKVVCLSLLVVGCIVFVSEYLILPTNETMVYLLLAPLGEELVKSSVVVVFFVSFVHYRMTHERTSQALCFDSLLLLMLLLYIITISEVFYPGNPFSGIDLLWLSMKKFAGHFALTMCGCLIFGFLYHPRMMNTTVVLLLLLSICVSVALHSLVNQIGVGLFIGEQLVNLGVSQEMFLSVLFAVSTFFLVLFLLSKEKENQAREAQG